MTAILLHQFIAQADTQHVKINLQSKTSTKID